MALAAAVSRGLQHRLACGILQQQSRGLAGAAALQQSTAAAVTAADGGAASDEQPHTLVKMNLCTAVNDALHIAMDENSK